MGDSKRNDRGCLILHGLGGGPYELEPLIGSIEKAGFRVAAPTLPGHDGPGPGMPASAWSEWAAAAESAFDQLVPDSADVSVLGFSTGGTLALRLASRRPVSRLVLIAPFLEIRHAGLLPVRPIRYLRHVARLIPSLPRRGPAVRDPEARRRAAAADRFRTFSLRAAASALELIEEVRPILPTIQTPALILQGIRDSVVEPRGAEFVLETLGARQKRLVLLPNSDHLVALDLDRDAVEREVLSFLLGD
ncbi:alpha/beta hydrolase [Aquisphaera insulae]|uniref:alpha/beta hydrolase n=1 Tax=Aquisphaera insulae TaxID=2712864 RepID=UPI0013E9ECE0|nr:alpha/beta fold hydrolase [Aquisphaera insulae]